MMPAPIHFGPPGPQQTVTYADNRVRVAVHYRIAPDREYGTGPAAAPPSIASGSLSLTVGGTTRTYDLADIAPIATHRLDIPRDAATGCGTGAPLTRRGGYVVLEMIVEEKGCSRVALFIDSASGRIAQSVVADHRWNHRLDVTPQNFHGVTMRVRSSEPVAIDAVEPGSRPLRHIPWPFALVDAVDTTGHEHLFAYTIGIGGAPEPQRGGSLLPAPGSTIQIGFDGTKNVLEGSVFGSEPLLRFDAAQDAQYAALQTPTPQRSATGIRRNAWFLQADDEASRGHFTAAVADFAHVLALENDPAIAAGDRTFYAACRSLQRRVNAGAMSEAAAAKQFGFGCAPPGR